MNAQQRQIFEDTLAEDEADLEAQLQALPEHLKCVEHHHESDNTTGPKPDCAQAMVRIGGDVSDMSSVIQ